MKEERQLSLSNFNTWTKEEKMALKKKVEKVLSDILSDKYDAKITITLKDFSEEDIPQEK